jgi:competence protein ComGB
MVKRNHRLSNEIQLRFLKRLHRLLTNGYPLLEALERFAWDKQMNGPAEKIASALKNGSVLDQAFDFAGFHFSITAYLYFVQANGDLAGGIEKSIEMFEYRTSTMKRFQQVLRYPVILLIIFSILLYFINQQVLPSFQDLFASQQTASVILNISITAIHVLSRLLLLLIIALSFALIIWYFSKHKLSLSRQIKLQESIPIWRSLVRMNTSFFFATHFSTLLKSGLSHKEILTFLKKQTKLPIIAFYSKQMTDDLNRGIHLGHVMSEFSFLDKQLASIFQKHTNRTELEKDLTVYAQMLLEDIEIKTIKTITYLQPVFFTALAIFVVIIYVMLMWPMFDLIKTI